MDYGRPRRIARRYLRSSDWVESEMEPAGATERWQTKRRQLLMTMESCVSAADVAGPVGVSYLMTLAPWTPARLVVHQHLSLADVAAAAAAADADVTFDSSPQTTSDLSKSQFRRTCDTVFYDDTTHVSLDCPTIDGTSYRSILPLSFLYYFCHPDRRADHCQKYNYEGWGPIALV